MSEQVKLPALKGGASERNSAVALEATRLRPDFVGPAPAWSPPPFRPALKRGAPWRRRVGDPDAMIRDCRRPGLWVAAGIATYTLIIGWVCQLKFSRCLYTDFDLAVHAQSIWNILRGSSDSSILGIPFLGNHMVLILYLLAPLYAVWPSPLLLLHLQTLALACGAWGIYLLARRELSNGWGLAFALIYLIYPPLIYMNLYEFHPIALATPLLIFALYHYRVEQFRAFGGLLLLAMLCQENVALIAIAFGVYALIERRGARWIGVPIAAGAVYFVAVVVFIMPRLNPYVQMYSMYSHLGGSFPEVVRTAALHPGLTLRSMWSEERLTFFNLLFAPLGYLSLLSPTSLVPALPIVLQRLLSSRATESALIYHYQAEFIPFVFAAAIHGIRRILGYGSHPVTRKVLVSLLSFFPALVFVIAVLVPGAWLAKREWTQDGFLSARKQALLRRIPSDAVVVTTFEFLSPLACRPKLYSLHHIYSGTYTLSTIPYPLPRHVDYVILNTQDRLTFWSPAFYQPSHYANLQRLFTNGAWEIIEHTEPLLAFRKRAETGTCLIPLAQPIDAVPDMNRNVEQPDGESLRLVGFQMGKPDTDRMAPLTLYWRKASGENRDFDVGLTIEGTATLYSGVLSPGSRIWPPQSWPAGSVIADQHRVHLTAEPVDPGRIHVRVKLISRPAGTPR